MSALMKPFADARSSPLQPCATTAFLKSTRQGVLQTIKLWALLGGLRTCRIADVAFLAYLCAGLYVVNDGSDRQFSFVLPMYGAERRIGLPNASFVGRRRRTQIIHPFRDAIYAWAEARYLAWQHLRLKLLTAPVPS